MYIYMYVYIYIYIGDGGRAEEYPFEFSFYSAYIVNGLIQDYRFIFHRFSFRSRCGLRPTSSRRLCWRRWASRRIPIRVVVYSAYIVN